MTLAHIIRPKPRDLGGFAVSRLLPQIELRNVGPFVFLDHIGPVDFPPGEGINVRPHPHIGLATITWLWSGEIFHRDSLGSAQAIQPGDVNWMTAGRGISHSERTTDETRARGQRLHGVQSWLALPKAHEETAPAFAHHKAASLPRIERDGARVTVIAGSAFGLHAPQTVFAPTLYCDLALLDGARIVLPPEHEERAVLVGAGGLEIEGERLEAGSLASFAPGVAATMKAHGDVKALILGGAKLDGQRHLWWNFVSSSKERIAEAKLDWEDPRRRRSMFGEILGDDEFIPLPSA